MSKIIAQVSNIQNIDNLNVVTFDCQNITLKMMSLDLSDKIKIGQKTLLRVKPTSVAIGKNIEGALSYSNQLNVKIISLKVGKLLCSLQLQFHDFLIESIITVDSQKRMHLELNDEVIALIKSSDLSIGEVL